MADQAPLFVSLENTAGKEVSLRIEPHDDFKAFVDKAKSILGYDIDINSVTKNQPVSLTDNVYEFLLRSESNLPMNQLTNQNFERILQGSNENEDLMYILDDGTQIRASQIHFDNEDPLVDLTVEKLPFVKFTDEVIDEVDNENVEERDTRTYNIVESPVSKWSGRSGSPKFSFVNSLPFKLICNNTSSFEAQFAKFLETSSTKSYATLSNVTSRNKSPRSLIRDNYKNYDDSFQQKSTDDFTHYTREEILNMFKDSPVTSLPYDNHDVTEKRRHVRKTDPSRLYKTWNAKPVPNFDVDNTLMDETESQNCFICNKYVDNNLDKLYLFDKEDQRLHRSSPQKKLSTQLKIICAQCLDEQFKPCSTKSPNQSLSPDEYLIIRNNEQYIFQKIGPFNYKTSSRGALSNMSDSKSACIDSIAFTEQERTEFVKVEIGSDGEIVTKPIDNDVKSDDVIIVKDEMKDSNSSDVEIIENDDVDDIVIDDFEEVDEDVKEFLGKYQGDNVEMKNLKCRFCEREFANVSEVIDHGETHKHDMEEGAVFPCPLCDYGYANFKWLKGHLKAAHDKAKIIEKQENEDGNENDPPNPSADPTMAVGESSPIATRTRSAAKRTPPGMGMGGKESSEKTEEDMKDTSIGNSKASGFVIKTEVKQEALGSSDDEIWIVQAADDRQLRRLLDAAKPDKDPKKFQCDNCSQLFVLAEGLAAHKCRRRGRKRKPVTRDDVIQVPTKEDFMKRAQGRLRLDESGDSNSLLTVRPRKRDSKPPSCNPQIVTCHNCNESFTSKVRLKFHMQFHESTLLLSPGGQYRCAECARATFATETQLFDHVHFQHKQKRWQCPVKGCGKTFYLRATLTKHSRTHTDTRRYACSTCGKRFLDKQTLDEHGVTHLQIKPFQCHICLKQLTRRSRLRMHLRAHEEELRPRLVLVCAVCQRAFRDAAHAQSTKQLTRRSRLRMHLQAHEEELRPRLVLVCAVCQRAFRDAAHAQEHVTNSPECIEEFANELKEESEAVTMQLSPTSGLVRHTVQVIESPKLCKPIRRQVAGPLAEPLLARVSDAARSIARVVEIEKAFRCEYCEDVFYSEDGLNKHRIIHKGVKNPFTCHICKVCFPTYSRCTTHKTTHGFYKRPLAMAARTGEEAGPAATGILGYGDFPVVKHFLCEDCGRSYLHWTYLQVHRRMKHAGSGCRHKCSQCPLTFPSSWGVAYHRKKAHGGYKPPPKQTRTDYRIPCRDCDEVLPNKSMLYKHRQKKHSDMSLRNDDAGSGDGVVEYRCEVCELAHPTRALLEAHRARAHSPAARPPSAPRRDAVGALPPLGVGPPARWWACARCPRRYRAKAELRAHQRRKHPQQLVLIEISGLNPTPEEVMEQLDLNNIPRDKVLEITKMSFPKGTTSIVPSSCRALSLLGSVPRATIACGRPRAHFESLSSRRGRSGKPTARPRDLRLMHSRQLPTSLDESQPAPVVSYSLTVNPPQFVTSMPPLPPAPPALAYPVALNMAPEELSALNVQLLLCEGGLPRADRILME